MSTTLMYVGIGAILATLVGIFAIAILFLQTARRYVDLTEKRLEVLREGEAFLLKIVQRQGRALEESLQREAEQFESVPEKAAYVAGDQRSETSANTPPQADPPRRPRGTRERRGSSAKEERPRARETEGEAASRREDDAPRLGVQVPHPDDDAPGRGWNKSPARFFQKCYDRYLEHYEGYVRLAERLHETRDGGTATDARGKREWEDKLRRAYDAIERTTQRLDVLEEHYPELATDSDRISSRIGTARLHADLTERFGSPR